MSNTTDLIGDYDFYSAMNRFYDAAISKACAIQYREIAEGRKLTEDERELYERHMMDAEQAKRMHNRTNPDATIL